MSTNPEFAKPKARVNLTVDVVVFRVHDGELQVLLIKRASEPFAGMYALPGGFLQTDEPTANAAARILLTKAGVEQVYTEQLYTFDGSGRDPRGMIPTVTYMALVPDVESDLKNSDTTQQPEFINARRLPALPFDHTSIIEYALKRLQSKLTYTNVAYSLLPKSFTLSQLQDVYEVILGEELDKRNFRKKIVQIGLVRATRAKLTGGRHRPAQLFQFTTRAAQELSRWF